MIFASACTFTVQGLWGGPFLREVHGLSPIEAGNVLLVAVIAYQVGMLGFGPLDRLLDTRKWIAIGGTRVIAHPGNAGARVPAACGCRSAASSASASSAPPAPW